MQYLSSNIYLQSALRRMRYGPNKVVLTNVNYTWKPEHLTQMISFFPSYAVRESHVSTQYINTYIIRF